MTRARRDSFLKRPSASGIYFASRVHYGSSNSVGPQPPQVGATELEEYGCVVTRPDSPPALTTSYRNRTLPLFVAGCVELKSVVMQLRTEQRGTTNGDNTVEKRKDGTSLLKIGADASVQKRKVEDIANKSEPVAP